MAPSASHSSVSRWPSPDRPWLPICVATPVSFATRASSRASRMLWVRGFSQYTCLPAFMATIAWYACWWSGVAMSIVIDGRLDEEIWTQRPRGDRSSRSATPTRDSRPPSGPSCGWSTTTRRCTSARGSTIGEPAPDRAPAVAARPDAEADHFALFLDAHHDHLTGAVFEVSAAGVQSDKIIFNDSWDDESWDAVWESAVTVDEGGWTVEMRIPFSQLRFPRAERHTFGIHAER
jgi:hypothetical protein